MFLFLKNGLQYIIDIEFDKKNFKVSVGDRMEFFQFKEDGSGNLKIIRNWIQ